VKTLDSLTTRDAASLRRQQTSVEPPTANEGTIALARALQRTRAETLSLAMLTQEALDELTCMRDELCAGDLQPADVVEEGDGELALSRVNTLRRSVTRLRARLGEQPEPTRDKLTRMLSSAPLAEAAEERLLRAARGHGTGQAEPSRLERLFSEGEAEISRLTTQIVVANQGLVTFVVKRYAGMGLSLSDLMQEGNIGLLRAVKKFDPNRGIRFNTYAVWWIRQAAQRALADQSRTIRVPVHVLEDRRALLRTSARLDSEGKPHSASELCAQTGFSPGKVSRLLDLAKEPLSLDAPRGPDDDTRLIDFISDSRAVDPTGKLIDRERKDQLAELLGSLSPRERHMLRMRFGMDGDECTLEQVGQAFGVTRERARQIVDGAVDKMRRAACRMRSS
jgi:RNA polymerase sigma factor (sigma-70 family)